MNKVDPNNITIDQIPYSESEYFEFKSSMVKNDIDSLKNKLGKAVSGFANSGGGYFIVGIDEKSGNADGGIPIKIGKRPIRDWVDTMIHQLVEPTPHYDIKLIKNSMGRGVIDQGSALLIVYIPESHNGPHMMDGSYYIRAGVHTIKARDFIVEAIRSKRFLSKPKLTHLFRLKPNQEQVLQLGILSLTDAPAVHVNIKLSPLPEGMQNIEKAFPIVMPIIDRNNPFFFDVALFSGSTESFGNNIDLQLEYFDLSSNRYLQNFNIGVDYSTPPIKIGNDPDKKVVSAIESIAKSISKLELIPKGSQKPLPIIPIIDNVFEYIENIISALLSDMKNDLTEYPFVREFVILSKKWHYTHNPHKDIFMYYFEDHEFLRNKIRILENCSLIYEITFNSIDRFIITEQLANYLLNKKQVLLN
ncbi:hypothetical protein GO730_05255 [Spirosoma sp. HMF3257]|uniref:Schlafen AlbA-2 domain-containing protein n=1 Tax=Spirosoma telluris TaxID=2183553 RepID=A0A327NHY6_9BACT|nr:hypothetical protein [Spirosoma telluris]RAI73919.1 hypothetical protein HMF3257_05225 [Spirosoma telluris]